MISVVIPAYNEEDWIGDTLKSLKDQNFNEDYEILVVNNASKDNTAKVARQYDVRIENEPIKGYTRACQTGFEKAKGSIIAMTDADTLVTPDWLAAVANSFERKEVVGAHGPCEFRDSTTLMNYLAKYGYTAFLRLNLMFGKPHLAGFNMAVKKSAFEKISGFKLSMDSASDVDLSMRLKEIGRVVYNPRMKVKVSSRRFARESFWGTFKYYTKNYINVAWLRRTDKASDFEDVRE